MGGTGAVSTGSFEQALLKAFPFIQAKSVRIMM